MIIWHSEETHVISFDVWYLQLTGKVLSNSAFAAACRACDDPHVAMVVGGERSMDWFGFHRA